MFANFELTASRKIKEQTADSVQRLVERADQAIRNNGDAVAAENLEYWKELLEESHRKRRRYFLSISSTILNGILEDKRVSDISEELKSEIDRQNDLYDRPWMRAKRKGWTPVSHVIFGLLLLLILVIVGGLTEFLWINFEYLEGGITFSRQSVSTICTIGAMGGLVSVFVRIQDYADMKDVDPLVLILIGFFKPIMGMVFAFFVFAILASDLVPISLNTAAFSLEQRELFYVALAFLAGFSERFARDILKTEHSVNANGNSNE